VQRGPWMAGARWPVPDGQVPVAARVRLAEPRLSRPAGSRAAADRRGRRPFERHRADRRLREHLRPISRQVAVAGSSQGGVDGRWTAVAKKHRAVGPAWKIVAELPSWWAVRGDAAVRAQPVAIVPSGSAMTKRARSASTTRAVTSAPSSRNRLGPPGRAHRVGPHVWCQAVCSETK